MCIRSLWYSKGHYREIPDFGAAVSMESATGLYLRCDVTRGGDFLLCLGDDLPRNNETFEVFKLINQTKN